MERDPHGKKQHEPGAKLDAGKPPVLRGALHYFPRSLEYIAKISEVGARKYTWKGWEDVPDGVNRYGDAMIRHVLAESIDGPTDGQTGLLHAGHAAWNALARLELMLKEGE